MNQQEKEKLVKEAWQLHNDLGNFWDQRFCSAIYNVDDPYIRGNGYNELKKYCDKVKKFLKEVEATK